MPKLQVEDYITELKSLDMDDLMLQQYFEDLWLQVSAVARVQAERLRKMVN